ncbi:MAG TPA: ribosome biogenesis GTP-binding protein YihA/YsxC [Saprospiraceae bacterium]|nr:ribosome biogenesis GTP-binding protein YihA/YsxC [Saprospiraceae bacterium]
MQITKATYLGSFASVGSCPVLHLPEYAFIGRSNVGKSSLINMLCNRKDLARVSNQPGKTRTINLYHIDHAWVLADLPGYGFAQVAKSMKEEWPALIREYLTQRENLICAFVLLDFRLPLQEIDRRFIAELGTRQVPFAMIYTKVDKVSRQQRETHTQAIESVLLEDWNELPLRFYTSAMDGEGREALVQYIGCLNDNPGLS